ncbi:MAG: sulfite exporter TauE/SafE family protein [Gemmataceae bacterium]
MGIPSLIGAVVASYLVARHVSHFWSHFATGTMLVVSAVNLVRSGKPCKDDPSAPRSQSIPLEVVIGLGLGALAAVTGLMLGSLRLPMMIRWPKFDTRVAVGSSIAIGSLTGLVAVATTMLAGEVEWSRLAATLALLTVPTVAGGLLVGWRGACRRRTCNASPAGSSA